MLTTTLMHDFIDP